MERDIRLSPEIQQHVSDMALEIARQGVRKLWSDTNSKETLPDELWKILERRLYVEACRYYGLIQILIHGNFQNPHPQITEFLAEGWVWSVLPGEDTPLLRRVYAVFLRQLEEYRKKHKKHINETIQRAKEGDTTAICQLIQWDPAFRDIDFIKTEIGVRSALQSEQDRLFLKRIAEAHGKRPVIKRYTDDSGLLILCELYANRYDLSGPNNSNLKRLHNALSNSGAFDKASEGKGHPLSEYKYFARYLNRHNIT